MKELEYWEECVSLGAEACDDLKLSPNEVTSIAESVKGGHENYGMAFYSPPSSDRINSVEREWKEKYDALQREFDAYRGNAEKAVKQALHQRSDSDVSIGSGGEVLRHGGRTERIQ